MLVIETISAFCLFEVGQQPHYFSVSTNFGEGTGAHIYIPLTLQSEVEDAIFVAQWVGTQQVRAYAAPGTEVTLLVLAESPYSSRYCYCSLCGYKLEIESQV